MPNLISQRIRGLYGLVRSGIDEQCKAIEADIEQRRRAGAIDDAQAMQLVFDVHNEAARIFQGSNNRHKPKQGSDQT